MYHTYMNILQMNMDENRFLLEIYREQMVQKYNFFQVLSKFQNQN